MLNHLWVKRSIKKISQKLGTSAQCKRRELVEIHNQRILTVGFDDIRLSDIMWLAPLFKRYGYTATFNKILYGKESAYEKIQIKKLIVEGHEIGCHTILHQQYPFFSPLCNGQDPDAPD